MSDEAMVRQAARDRLFDASLGDAVRAEFGTAESPRPRRHSRVLQAALLLFAVAITIAIAVLRSTTRDEAQDPNAFDPLWPRVENEWLWGPPMDYVRDADSFERLVTRDDSKKLAFLDSAPIDAETWRRVGRMTSLEALILPQEGWTKDDLRELRHAPNLRAIVFGGSPEGTITIDAPLVESLLELPHLSCLFFSICEVHTAALERLAGLPNLQALSLIACDLDPSWTTAMVRLRTLRWLLCVHGFGPKPEPLPHAQFRQLVSAPKLTTLCLSNANVAEADLAALPASIEVFGVDHQPLSGAAVRALASRPGLRGLWLGGLNDETERALCEVLPRTRLEYLRFAGTVSARLWDALLQMRTLRHLAFRIEGDDVDALRRCARLDELCQLDLEVSGFPGPFDGSPLQALTKLRRLTVKVDKGVGLDATEIATLRAGLRPGVELVMPR